MNRTLFTIFTVSLMITGCQPSKKVIQPESECYSRQEVDQKIDSLRQEFTRAEDSMVVIKEEIAGLRDTVYENRSEFRNYRKNITAIKIPDTVDFCGQRIPLERHHVRQAFEKVFMLLLEDQAQLMLYKQRSNLFFPTMDSLLVIHNMPGDLKYIAVTESALKPKATSRAKAQGFWQFIYWTASRYGIESNSFVDMRNNLIASTIGAIAYFSKLLGQFSGDWFLAFAGYNMGEHGLAARISEQGTDDYFELVLPAETEEYVFRAAAVKCILEDPDRYGIPQENIVPWEAPPTETVKVKVNNRLKVRWVADWCQTTYRQIYLMNPELKGEAWGPGEYEIKIPAGTRELFFQGLSDVKSGKYKP